MNKCKFWKALYRLRYLKAYRAKYGKKALKRAKAGPVFHLNDNPLFRCVWYEPYINVQS